jgi:hypothetical protein
VGWYDWLLFLHVAGAFVFGMAFVTYWGAVIVGARPQGGDPNTLAQAITRPANLVVPVGAFVALVFGIWLAIYVDGYEVWDAWIVISLLLLIVAVGAGVLAGRSYVAAMERPEPEAAALRRRGILLHSTASLAFLVILVLMIFKPGA